MHLEILRDYLISFKNFLRKTLYFFCFFLRKPFCYRGLIIFICGKLCGKCG